MNLLDWVVLLGTIVGIALYGAWRTRHTDNLNTYLKGNHNTGWVTIGISVAATQASAITFLSIPGRFVITATNACGRTDQQRD